MGLYLGVQEAVRTDLYLAAQEEAHTDPSLAELEEAHTDPFLVEPEEEHTDLYFEAQEAVHTDLYLEADIALYLLEAAEAQIHTSSLLVEEDIVLFPVLAEGHKGLSAGYKHLLVCYRTRFVLVLCPGCLQVSRYSLAAEDP